MGQPESTNIYLYTLATVAITFVGFSALLLVFRQSIGGGLTRYDTYFTLTFIQSGFIVTAGALLPPLFALNGWSQGETWRGASGIVSLVLLWFIARLPSRRRQAVNAPVPAFVWALLSLQTAATLALVAIAVGGLNGHGPGVYASSLTTILFSSGVAYLMALGVIRPELTAKLK